MGWLLVLALLPLDVTAPPPPKGAARTAPALRLYVYADGRHVGARLVNSGPRRVKLWLGETCSGPAPFEAIIDGVSHPFIAPVACDKNVDRFEWIEPGEETRVVSAVALLGDEREHRVEVRYHAASPPLEHDVWRGELRGVHINLTAAVLIPLVRVVEAPTPATHAMTVEVEHVWRGAQQMRFFTGWEGACPQPADEVLVDGAPHGSPDDRICDGPALATAKVVQPGGSFTVRQRVSIDGGRHEVRARYRVDASQARAIERADNLGEWTGTVESAPIRVETAP
jgi:hypothetical protein